MKGQSHERDAGSPPPARRPDTVREERAGVAWLVSVESVRPVGAVQHLGRLVDDHDRPHTVGPELVDVSPNRVAAHGDADQSGIVQAEMLKELADVAAVPRHPLTEDAEPGRDEFEIDLARRALSADLPTPTRIWRATWLAFSSLGSTSTAASIRSTSSKPTGFLTSASVPLPFCNVPVKVDAHAELDVRLRRAHEPHARRAVRP